MISGLNKQQQQQLEYTLLNAWLSQLGNFKNAIWTWGHFLRVPELIGIQCFSSPGLVPVQMLRSGVCPTLFIEGEWVDLCLAQSESQIIPSVYLNSSSWYFDQLSFNKLIYKVTTHIRNEQDVVWGQFYTE